MFRGVSIIADIVAPQLTELTFSAGLPLELPSSLAVGDGSRTGVVGIAPWPASTSSFQAASVSGQDDAAVVNLPGRSRG